MISVLFMVFSIFAHTGGSLKSELDEYLKKNFSGYKEFQYEIVEMPENFKKASILKTNELNVSGNLAYVPVKVVTDDNRVTKTFITIRLKLFQEVLVAVKPIKSRETLTAGDFQLEKVDVTQVRGSAVKTLKGIETLRSKISLRTGDVLVKEAVEAKPIINVGDQVNASVSSGSVYVSTEATARQEGLRGDIIQIITKDKKLFKAKIIDSKNVLIIE